MDMINIKSLGINRKLQIINKDNTFFEAVIKILYDDFFIVQIQNDQPNCRLIKVEETIDFLLIYDDQAFRCSSKVLQNKVGDNFQSMLLTVPTVVKRIERRQFTRLNIVLPIEYSFITDDKDYKHIKAVPSIYLRKLKKTYTIDISGGGANIITYESLDNCKNVLLSLRLAEEMKMICSIVRVEHDETNRNFRTALKFEYIEDSHRALIIDYVNKKINSTEKAVANK